MGTLICIFYYKEDFRWFWMNLDGKVAKLSAVSVMGGRELNKERCLAHVLKKELWAVSYYLSTVVALDVLVNEEIARVGNTECEFSISFVKIMVFNWQRYEGRKSQDQICCLLFLVAILRHFEFVISDPMIINEQGLCQVTCNTSINVIIYTS